MELRVPDGIVIAVCIAVVAALAASIDPRFPPLLMWKR